MIGRLRKFWFLDPLKRLYSHFYYVIFKIKKCKRLSFSLFLCYISFYTGKIPRTFLPTLVSLLSHLRLLHSKVCIGDLSFILFLRFSIAEEKTKMACETVSNRFMQLRQLHGYQKAAQTALQIQKKKKRKKLIKKINGKSGITSTGKNHLRNFPNIRQLY